MSWNIRQTRRFIRTYKNLQNNIAIGVDMAVVEVLGYTRDDSVRLIYLEAIGPHENFYRDLKR